MLTRTTLLIICLASSLSASALIKYNKTFAEWAMARISTPSAAPQKATAAAPPAAYSISFADPVQLPVTDPWQRAAQMQRPRPSSSNVGTVFVILGPILLIAGLIIFLVGDAHTNDGDWLNNTFNQVFVKVAGLFLMVAGGVFTIIGSVMKLSMPEGGKGPD